MKIIFINPPTYIFTGQPANNSPVLGIMFLATVLSRAGYQAKVIDADALELSWEDLIYRIKKENPDIIGLTATTLSMPALYKTAEVCRVALPIVKILAGGFGPTLEPEKTLRECLSIDILGLDECEITIIELIKCLENNGDLSQVKGIAFRGIGDRIIKTPPQPLIDDLDTIPPPDFSLLEPKISAYKGMHGDYEGISMPNIVIMGSRGCPHRCIFCSIGKKRPRFRSPKKIVDEIEFYKKEFGIKSVHLYDNEFIGMTAGQNQWVQEICQEIINRGLNDLGFVCQGRCSRFIDLATLKEMRQAGFRWIWWGVESGSQKILNRIKKDLKVEDVYRAFKLAKEANIYSLMFIMVGLPDETKEDVKKSIQLIKKIKPDKIRVHITTPLPGSELWDELYSKNQIDEFDYFKYDSRLTVVHHTDTMSQQDIKKYYQLILFRFENGYWLTIKFLIKSLLTADGWRKLSKRIGMIANHFINRFRVH